MRALAAVAGDLGFRLDAGDDVRVQRERGLPQVLQGARLAEAGELLEHFADVTRHFVVGRQQAEVGVQAGGARVVVAGAQVGVALEAAFLAAHDEQRPWRGSCSRPRRTRHGRRPVPAWLASRCWLPRRSGPSVRRPTVTSLPFCAARISDSISTESVPVRYTVILIATTAGSVAAWLRNSITGAKDW